MGFLKLFGGRSPEKAEERGDAFILKDEYGLAKMEYEDALDRLEKSAQENEEMDGRLKDKLQKTKEILSLSHKEEGLEIMDSGNYDAAASSFELALELTEDPEMIQELNGLLEEFGVGSSNERDVEKGVQGAELQAEGDEYFAALCCNLPEPIQREFYQYGTAFKEGYLALNEGNFDLAAEKLLQAMEENPEGVFIAIELATVYLNLDRYPEARTLAEGFLESYPDSVKGYQVLCEILWAMEEFDRALEWLGAYPDTPAEYPPLLLLRGETLLRAGRAVEAERLYQKELELKGWQPDIARALSVTFEANGQKEEARDLFGKLLAECRSCGAKSDLLSKRKFSDLSFELGDYSTQILELYLSLVQEDPSERADYYQKISRIYSARGNDEEARRFEAFAQQARGGSVG